jgi:hypothetical protein
MSLGPTVIVLDLFHRANPSSAIVNTNLTLDDSQQEFNLIKKQGKVRDIYNTNEYVIIVATDRQSAFDRNLAGVPFKVRSLVMIIVNLS